MKIKFSTTWNSSSQSRKQRKFRANAPAHTKGKFLHANLAKDLREKLKTRSLRVRVGDEVEVLRGQYKGEKGQVDKVDTKKSRLIIRGVDAIKLDGSKRPYPIAASNVRITKIAEDPRRNK